MLVTLLTKATTLQPDLPLFAPDFQARASAATSIPSAIAGNAAGTSAMAIPTNGHGHPLLPYQSSSMSASNAGLPMVPRPSFQATAGAPAYQNNMMSAPANDFVPEGHPPHYPRPGHGLMQTLPREQEDLQWLVEDDDRYGAFSHYYQANPSAPSMGLNGGMHNMQ